MKRTPIPLFAVSGQTLLLAAVALLPAQGFESAQTSEAERLLLADARDGSLQQFDYVEAALVASGVTNQNELNRWLRVRDARYAAIDLRAIGQLPLAQRPAAILAGLHREILAGRFQPTATLLHDTLATGEYNCVTATVLYHDLCTRCGVPVEVIAQSGHVSSLLRGSPVVEIETTRRDWFSLPATDHTTPAVRHGEPVRRVISPTALLGRIYYNRALAALEQREFALAIELLKKSLVLDSQDRDAQENLLAGLNNWALALCEAGEFSTAAEHITSGLALNANYGPLRSNDLHVHQQWVAHLCQQAEFAQALQVLESGRGRRPDAPLFTSGKRAVYEAWLQQCAKQGDSKSAAEVVRLAQLELGTQLKLTVEAHPKPRVIPAHSRKSAVLSGGTVGQ